MVHLCDKPCGNKTESGYCATTACINPKYSNIGTAQYGQGVQKCIVTNADRIRAMSDEELAIHFSATTCPSKEAREKCVTYGQFEDDVCVQCWLDWLKQEVET